MTTQFSNECLIATNVVVREGRYTDEKLAVDVCAPKIEITAENKKYLQLLDAMELLDTVPIDAEEPYAVLAKYIQREHLRYSVLFRLANHYNQNT